MKNENEELTDKIINMAKEAEKDCKVASISLSNTLLSIGRIRRALEKSKDNNNDQ